MEFFSSWSSCVLSIHWSSALTSKMCLHSFSWMNRTVSSSKSSVPKSSCMSFFSHFTQIQGSLHRPRHLCLHCSRLRHGSWQRGLSQISPHFLLHFKCSHFHSHWSLQGTQGSPHFLLHSLCLHLVLHLFVHGGQVMVQLARHSCPQTSTRPHVFVHRRWTLPCKHSPQRPEHSWLQLVLPQGPRQSRRLAEQAIVAWCPQGQSLRFTSSWHAVVHGSPHLAWHWWPHMRLPMHLSSHLTLWGLLLHRAFFLTWEQGRVISTR